MLKNIDIEFMNGTKQTVYDVRSIQIKEGAMVANLSGKEECWIILGNVCKLTIWSGTMRQGEKKGPMAPVIEALRGL